MNENDILLIKASEIGQLLEGKEAEIQKTIQLAYQVHSTGDSTLPHSVFLRFPDNDRDRIIGLPTYIGGDINSAGIKWISSFPGNHDLGYPRASAVLILNSLETGSPTAILEGSIISAKRTAASAALAAHTLHQASNGNRLGVIGCGLINTEIVRFLLSQEPKIDSIEVFDQSSERAEEFISGISAFSNAVPANVRTELNDLLSSSSIVSFATTAIEPHVDDLSICPPGTTILHVSLRDLTPRAILSGDNVVDDIDHICRAQTSVHLAEGEVGNRGFIRCTLADILNGDAVSHMDEKPVAIFSPFGLGVLDLALAEFVKQQAIEQGIGTWIDSFLPTS
jgi:2,3-diaminopropionate biosynthesis protein SbnB